MKTWRTRERVPLRFHPTARYACVRELSGREESGLRGAASADAVALIDGVLVPEGPNALPPGQAAQLTASDRDRILAALYLASYGPLVRSTLECADCRKPFDMDFLLGDAQRSLDAGAPAGPAGPREEYHLRTRGGMAFRLPTFEDESATLGLDPAEGERVLAARCVADARAREGEAWAEVQAAMEQAAPLLDLEVEAACPECGARQHAHFDIQRYLLSALRLDAGGALRDLHCLAAAYGWSREEILSLPRGERRALVALVVQTGGERVERVAGP